jgi:Na+/H+ antiporter NhaC
MFIALPMAVPIAASMVAQNPALTASYLPLCIGCSLTGCIFGDHCSPITDCTILSSQGAGCDNFDHVKTQLPYALTTAAVSVIAGILPSTFGVPAWASILLGSLCFYLILNAFGQVPGMKPAAARNASLLRRRRLRPARTAA